METRFVKEGDHGLFSIGLDGPHQAEVKHCPLAQDDDTESYPHHSHFWPEDLDHPQYICTGWLPKISVKRGGIKYERTT